MTLRFAIIDNAIVVMLGLGSALIALNKCYQNDALFFLMSRYMS